MKTESVWVAVAGCHVSLTLGTPPTWWSHQGLDLESQLLPLTRWSGGPRSKRVRVQSSSRRSAISRGRTPQAFRASDGDTVTHDQTFLGHCARTAAVHRGGLGLERFSGRRGLPQLPEVGGPGRNGADGVERDDNGRERTGRTWSMLVQASHLLCVLRRVRL